ncbi:MAG: hypothetical protein JRI25_07910 [Deltaproteobacteria bacterium]|nr:hypothetical protein [Deltaproteobacteria bacterium]MBW2254508.1 hypothetical protein [Deltaproteobacteria bacterium]
MDAVLPVICLLLGIALPVGVLYLVARRAWRQLAVADAYRIVARSLGLSVDTRGLSLHGHLRDRRLYIGEVMEGHGTERRIQFRGILALERPLGLGLLVRRRAARGWLRRRARASAVRTKEGTFAHQFEVFGDDEARVHDTLDEDVVAAILAFAHRWPNLTITDHHIRVLLKQPEASALGLGDLVDAVQDLADNLMRSRRVVAPPDALAPLIDPWSALGKEIGLKIEPCFPSLVGTLEERQVLAVPRREWDGYAVEVVVRFAEHRPLGFLLRPQVEPNGYWSVGQDIQVGDPDFDRGFVIKGYDPSAVRRLLSDEVRHAILRLAQDGRLHVEATDRELRIRRVPLDAESIGKVLRDAVRVTTAIRW